MAPEVLADGVYDDKVSWERKLALPLILASSHSITGLASCDSLKVLEPGMLIAPSQDTS